MGPSLGKSGPVSKKFLEDRRDFLLWLKTIRQPGPQGPSYLINEQRDYILFGGDRIIVKEAGS